MNKETEIIKFVQTNTARGLYLPAAAMKMSGFDVEQAVEYHTLPEAVIVLKKQMTALELANAVHSLRTLYDELFNALCNVCGECEGCSEECPYGTTDFEMAIELPEALLDKAGIPSGTRLFAAAAEGGVLICPADQVPSLQSVPGELMDDLLACDVCPGELDEHILKRDIVYGE